MTDAVRVVATVGAAPALFPHAMAGAVATIWRSFDEQADACLGLARHFTAPDHRHQVRFEAGPVVLDMIPGSPLAADGSIILSAVWPAIRVFTDLDAR